MRKKKQSRREFLKQNSIAGLGAVFASGITPSLFASTPIHPDKPALLGGKAVFTGIWPKWPMWNTETDEKRLLEVMRSGVWSRQNVVSEFEKKWAEATGARRCLTVVNGTNALVVTLI